MHKRRVFCPQWRTHNYVSNRSLFFFSLSKMWSLHATCWQLGASSPVSALFCSFTTKWRFARRQLFWIASKNFQKSLSIYLVLFVKGFQSLNKNGLCAINSSNWTLFLCWAVSQFQGVRGVGLYAHSLPPTHVNLEPWSLLLQETDVFTAVGLGRIEPVRFRSPFSSLWSLLFLPCPALPCPALPCPTLFRWFA